MATLWLAHSLWCIIEITALSCTYILFAILFKKDYFLLIITQDIRIPNLRPSAYTCLFCAHNLIYRRRSTRPKYMIVDRNARKGLQNCWGMISFLRDWQITPWCSILWSQGLVLNLPLVFNYLADIKKGFSANPNSYNNLADVSTCPDFRPQELSSSG